MKIYEIENIIENEIPKNIAYDWDNVGLLVGSKNSDVKKALLTLDTNLFTVNEAISESADIIISHHPIFFEPLKRISYDTAEGKLVKLLIENNIALYAAHTNMDVAKNGINTHLAKMFNLENIEIIEKSVINPSVGLGRYGNLKKPVEFSLFIEAVKMLLKTPIRYCGDKSKIIKKVAVASGACAELWEEAKALGCDVLITADLKYHQMINAYENGICIIDAGHYPTEICVMDIFEELLSKSDLALIKSKNKDIFNFSR